jgi:hypothetical protein
MIWFIILTVLMSDGTMYTDIHVANNPEYNNEKSCNEAGQIMVDQKQLEIGTNTGTAYFICKAITEEEFKKGNAPKTNS